MKVEALTDALAEADEAWDEADEANEEALEAAELASEEAALMALGTGGVGRPVPVTLGAADGSPAVAVAKTEEYWLRSELPSDPVKRLLIEDDRAVLVAIS